MIITWYISSKLGHLTSDLFSKPADVHTGSSFLLFFYYSLWRRDMLVPLCKSQQIWTLWDTQSSPSGADSHAKFQSHLNLPFLPHSEARFEPQRVVFSRLTCLNVLLHSAAAVWLESWASVKLYRCTKKGKTSIRIRLINAGKGAAQVLWSMCRLSGPLHVQKWRVQKNVSQI